MSRRVISSLFLILVALALVVSSVGCGAKTKSPTTYKIGWIGAITGGAAFLGVPERDAAAMVQKELDAQGGIKGPDGVMHPVQIIIMDSESKPDVTITVAKKLIDDEGVVAIVGTTASGTSMALVPVMMEAEVPMISMASSSAIVKPVAERKWIFKTAQSNEHTAPWQVRYCAEKGLTKIANFYVDDAYGEDGAEGVRAAAAEAGVEIVLEETFAAADKDMTAQLTKLKASDAQALVVTAIPPAAAVINMQFREMAFDIPIIHNHGIGMKPFISLAGDSAEGVLFPMGKLVAADALPDSDPQKAVLKKFVSDFEANSEEPVSTFAGHSWDALNLVIKGLEQLENGLTLKEQRTQLRDTIEGIQGFAGTGGIFNLSAQDHVGLSPDDVVMARITGGDWVYYPPEEW
ncbi:MAG: ABC transporter substrate-binding protein [Anaerolineae bacterium]|nr:ABC transporter substrate-binding protein [Anaerolineae bacterium]